MGFLGLIVQGNWCRNFRKLFYTVFSQSVRCTLLRHVLPLLGSRTFMSIPLPVSQVLSCVIDSVEKFHVWEASQQQISSWWVSWCKGDPRSSLLLTLCKLKKKILGIFELTLHCCNKRRRILKSSLTVLESYYLKKVHVDINYSTLIKSSRSRCTTCNFPCDFIQFISNYKTCLESLLPT